MKKAALKKSGPNEILFFYTFLGFLMTLPFAPQAFTLSGKEIFYVFLKSSACSVAFLFSFLALKKMSVSLYSIMDLSRVLFSTSLGVLILGESFTIYKAIGMVLVILGLLLVNLKKQSQKAPLTLFTLFAIFMNCFFNAISGIFDKVLMKSILPTQMQFWFMLFMTIIYGIILLVKREQISFKTVTKNYWIPIMSFTLVFGDLLLFYANAAPASQVTLMTLIKQSAIIVSVVSAKFVFKEKNILYKLMCAAIVVSGIIIPLIFK